jgi:hypothetical protein
MKKERKSRPPAAEKWPTRNMRVWVVRSIVAVLLFFQFRYMISNNTSVFRTYFWFTFTTLIDLVFMFGVLMTRYKTQLKKDDCFDFEVIGPYLWVPMWDFIGFMLGKLSQDLEEKSQAQEAKTKIRKLKTDS